MTDQRNNNNNRSIFPQVIDSPRLVFEYQDGNNLKNELISADRKHAPNEQKKQNAREQRRQKRHDMLTKRLLM